MHDTSTSTKILQKYIKKFPSLLFILGTGWNSLVGEVESIVEVPYDELFGVKTSVPGHVGKLVIGKLGSQTIALMTGRFHTYEGYSAEEVTRPIQVFASLGLKKVIITSASGALNEKYQVGDFVILSDIITTFCTSPLTGAKFIDMSEVFSLELRTAAKKICIDEDISFKEGIYCFTRGPHFETPADKMLMHHLGADVVGMSTVPETIMARSLDMKVLGLSFVTNLAFVKHDHTDVLDAAKNSQAKMVKILKGLVYGK